MSTGVKQLSQGYQSVRRWLIFFTLEGVFANTFIVLTGGAFLTGLALFLGAGDFEIGLLAALPFLAQLAQPFSAWLVDKTGKRKSITMWGAAGARQIWWLLLPLLFIAGSWRLDLFLVVVAVSSIAVMVATPAWMSWVADVVPERVRGRYFGSRSAAVTVSTIITTIIGGVILDHFQGRQHSDMGFAIIVGAACLFAAAALVVMQKIPDRDAAAIRSRTDWSSFLRPLNAVRFRHLLFVFFGWNMAIGLSAAFFAPHMLNNLGMSFTEISLYSCLFSLAAIALNRPWGKMIDHFGSKPVAAFCAFGIALIPLVWLFVRPGLIWILGFEAAYSGSLWAGFNLAAFNIPIANSPKEHRIMHLAMFSVITGIGFFVASIAGGLLAEAMSHVRWEIGPQTIVNYHILFAVSALLRFGAAALITTFHEPHEGAVPVMVQFMGYSVIKRLSAGRQIFPFGINLHTDSRDFDAINGVDDEDQKKQE